MLKLLMSNIQNLQKAKFYSCQIKLVYSIHQGCIINFLDVFDVFKFQGQVLIISVCVQFSLL